MKEFLIILLFFMFSCSDKEKKQTIIDPNNTSEMALLMRDMFTHLETIKGKIENGESLSLEQLDFEIIHKQKATDESFLKEGLVPMSKEYSLVVKDFNENPTKNNYKSIVNTCISCHQSLCPGPLERIDNLILK
jgi:hypothetical protein